jgi:serine/threonine protein phosphatase PrpC
MPEAYPPQQTYAQPGAQQMPAPALLLEVYGATDKGRQREGNEDAVYPHSAAETFPFQPGPDRLARKGQLLVVADGVGGARAGHEASHWAIRVAVERYYDLPGPDLGTDLRTAIEIANSSLYQYLQSTGTQESGCTMAAAVIHGNTLYVANVGDSRVYLLRNGQMTRLTRDHTLTQQKIDQGLILPEQAEMDPDRSVLTRSLGARPTVQVDLFQPLQLAPGDVVLVCSDGLTDMLAEEEIGQLMDASATKHGARRLIAAANKRGGFDNISTVLAQGESRPPEAGCWAAWCRCHASR